LGAYGLNDYPNNGTSDFGGSGWWYVLVGFIWFLIWFPLMDPLKMVVRSVMKGEIFLFKHKFSLHFQLIHGHSHHGVDDHLEWEEHVITAQDLAHIPHQLRSKMARKFHKHPDKSDEGEGDSKSSRHSEIAAKDKPTAAS